MIAAAVTRIGTFFAGLWVKIGVVLVGLAALAGAYAAIRKGGRDAQRLDTAIDVAKRTRIATQARIEASKPITPKEEADDPFNRDRR